MRISHGDLERLERVVIGVVLSDNSKYDEFDLVSSDFSNQRRKSIYGSIEKLLSEGRQANVVSVNDMLGNQTTYLSELESYIDTLGDPTYAASMVKKESRLRHLKLVSAMIAESLSEEDPEAITDMVYRELDRMADQAVSEIKTTDLLIHDVVNEVERLFKNKGDILGITSGFPAFDKETGGFQNGEYVVIAARTGIGKTEFMVNLAVNQMRNGIRCGIFSAEMASTRMMLRLLCTVGMIDFKKIRKGDLKDADFKMIQEASDEIYKGKLFLDDTPAIKFSDIRAKARRMARLGARIIYVDYLTLVKYGGQNIPRHERVGELSKGFQKLARELDIPVVVLSQLNRDGEGKEPSLDMLRQSGEIEEDADLILFLHRNRYEKNTDLIIAKSRDGANGKIPLTYLSDRSRYVERETHYDQ